MREAMNNQPSIHQSVLLKETIEGLNLPRQPIVIDCTFGGGGHSLMICKNYPGAKLIALDQDRSVFELAKEKFENENCNLAFFNANFRDLNSLNFPNNSVDGIIFDLGLSSDQLEHSGRGFSFIRNEPLLMTMKALPVDSWPRENPSPEDLTAQEIVNTWEEKNLADIIYGYGEEKFARRIAKAIIIAREKKEIRTTEDLVKIIESAVPGVYKRARIHFATRTFQALRIAVNDELRALEEGLEAGFEKLKLGSGRMAVIAFHSLEDRIVKNFFRKLKAEDRAELINKKPIMAGEEEIKNNPRELSAKLRILQKK